MDRDGMARTRGWFAGIVLVPLLIAYFRVPYTPLAAEAPIAILALFVPFLLPVPVYYLAVRGRKWTIACGAILVAFVALPWTMMLLNIEPWPLYLALGVLTTWLSVLLGAAVTGYKAAARRLRKADLAA